MKVIQNLSSAFNAYTGAVHRATLIYWSGGQCPGSMGVRCLAQGHLSRDKEVNCLHLLAHQSYFER